MKNVTWEKAFEDDEKLLEKVKSTIKDTRKALNKKYRDIGMGDAFYRGDHYGEWSDESRSWKEENINEDDRPRIVSNQIKVYVDKAVTKITRYKPNIMTTPMSNEETDVKGSKVAEELLHHFFAEQDIDDVQERWVKSAAKTGIGWMKFDWNPFLREKIEDFEETKTPDGKEITIKKETLYKGDVEITLPRSGNIIPDMISSDFRKHRYLIEEMVIPLDTLKKNYEKAEKIQSDMSSKSSSGSNFFGKEKSDNDTKVWELWFPPSAELPSGGYAIGTEDVVLDKITPFPHKHGKIPYMPLIFTSDDEYLWSDGVPQPLIPLQVEFNKIKNVRVENQNYAAAIKFLNPTATGYDADLMTNEPGEVIDFNGDVPPSWSQPMTASQELTESLDQILKEMQDISMVSSTSQGRPPDNARSGIMLQYLIENDDMSFAPVIRRMEKGIVNGAYLVLELIKQYWEDEDDRYYKIIGKNKEYQLRKFKKTSLAGKYDVIIQNSNANPLSKAYKMDTIMQLIQYQVLDAKDRPMIGEALEVGNIKGVYEDLEIDRLRAQKEIEKILEGNPHEILKCDDDEEHIATKQRYLKSEYDNLSNIQRQALLAAIDEHEQQAAAKAPQALPPMPEGPEGQMPDGPPEQPMM